MTTAKTFPCSKNSNCQSSLVKYVTGSSLVLFVLVKIDLCCLKVIVELIFPAAQNLLVLKSRQFSVSERLLLLLLLLTLSKQSGDSLCRVQYL